MVLAVFPSDPAGVLRLLNALLIGVTQFLVGYTVFISTKSLLSALFSQLFIASQVDMLNAHIFLWSEPLFLCFIAGILLSLALFQRTKKVRYVAIAIGIAALLPIIRYAGVVIIPFMLIALWVLTTGTFAQKLMRTIRTGTILVLPIGLWTLAMRVLQNERSIREFAIHIIEPHRIQEGASTLLGWIFPQSFVQGNLQNMGVFFLFVIIVAFIVVLIKRNVIRESLKNVDFVWLPILFAVGYISFLVISISFFDAYTPLDGRILSPIILMIAYVIGHILTQKNVVAHVIATFVFIMMIGFHVTSQITFFQTSYTKGLPFSSQEWRESETIAFMIGMEEEVTIYSNLPHQTTILTGRNDIVMFPRMFTLSGAKVLRYERQISNIKAQGGEKYIVFFKGVHSGTWRYPGIEDLDTLLSLEKVADLKDGVVFKVK
jgi:hypothetical protein